LQALGRMNGEPMRRPEFIAKQSRFPSGILGTIFSRVMAVETAAENSVALDFLKIQPGDRVLEVGFGAGRTIARAAGFAHDGFASGVDWSERMLRVATYYNRRLIAEGRVELKLGVSSELPYRDHCFDKVYSVHTIYFWTNPMEDLREMARVMRPGARFALGFRPRDEKTSAIFPKGVYTHYAPEEVHAILTASGFKDIQLVARRPSKRPFCIALAGRSE